MTCKTSRPDLSGPTVDVMQADKNRFAYNLTIFLGWSMFGRIFIKRHMSSTDIVILENVFVQNVMQMFFFDKDHVFEAFTAKCSDHSFADWVLLRTSTSSRFVFKSIVFLGKSAGKGFLPL